MSVVCNVCGKVLSLRRNLGRHQVSEGCLWQLAENIITVPKLPADSYDSAGQPIGSGPWPAPEECPTSCFV